MKLCFPVAEDRGINSKIYGHFNSAPFFFIVDADSLETETVANIDPDNPATSCTPFAALKGHQIDGLITAGMGDSALQAMHLCGFRAYEAQSENLLENMEMFKRKELPESLVQDSAAQGRCSDGDDTADSGSGSCGDAHEH